MSASQTRVALCTSGEIWGGVETCVRTLARGLQRTGLPVSAILFHDRRLAAALREDGVPVAIATAGKYDPRIVERVGGLLDAAGATVLHVHGYKATVVGSLAAGRRGIPVVKTVHGALEPPGGWRHAARHVRMRGNLLLDRTLTRRSAAAIAFVSRAIERGSRQQPRVPRAVIYNGLEGAAARTDTARARSGDASFRVGIIGRLVAVKGHDTLIDAATRLRHLGALRVHVFGEGPLEREYRSLCERAAIADRVRFEGFRDDVRQRMASLDVLAMPSRAEGLPYTLLEAMASRVPIVASAVGGIPEALDGGCGLLVPPADSGALAGAIERLYRERPLRVRLAAAAARRLRERFSAERMTAQYLDLYHQARA